MTITDLALYLHDEIGEPTDPSLSDIKFTLLNLPGELNNLISTNYEIVDNEYSPKLGNDEASVLGNIYLIKYYNRLVKQKLGASAFGWSELTEGDSTIRVVSNNEIAKTYISNRKDLQVYLKELCFHYKRNRCLAFYYTYEGYGFNVYR